MLAARNTLVLTRVARWLLVAQLVALAMIAAFGHELPFFSGETDFVRNYGPQAQDALRGRLTIDDFRGPLYPLLVAAISHVTGLEVFRAAIWLSVLASLGVTRLVLTFGEQLSDQTTAVVMTCLMLASSSFLGFSYVASTDMLFLFCALSIVYLFARCEHAGSHLAIGALSGLATLLRYNALLLVLAGCAWIALRACRERRLRGAALPMACYLLGVACLVVPWGLLLLERKGSFLYNKNYLNLAFSFYARNDWEAFFYPGPGDRAPNCTTFSSFTQVVLYDPLAIAAATLRGLFLHPLEDMSGLIGLHLAALLLPLPWTARAIVARLRQHPLGVFGAIFFLGSAPMFYTARLYLFLLPCYCYALAYNLLTIYAWLGAARRARVTTAAFAAIALCVTLVHQRLRAANAPHELQRLSLQIAARGISLRGARVIARKPHFCHFSACEHVDLVRLRSLDELAMHMCAQNIAYVLFSTSEQQTRPALAALADSARAKPTFTLIASAPGKPAAHLYRLAAERCELGDRSPLSSATAPRRARTARDREATALSAQD